MNLLYPVSSRTTRRAFRVQEPKRFDRLFYLLGCFCAVEIGILAYDLWASPNSPGIVMQHYLLRIVYGLVLGPSALGMGIWLLRQAGGNGVGRFLILYAVGAVAAQFNFGALPARWQGLGVIFFVLFGAGITTTILVYLLFTFPTGSVYPPRAARWLLAFFLLRFCGVLLEIMASQRQVKFFPLAMNPLFVAWLAPYHALIALTIGITGIIFPLGLSTGLASLIFRYRIAPVGQKRQIRWVLWALALLILMMATLGIFTFNTSPASDRLNVAMTVAAGCVLFLFISIVIAVWRYRLFDIDFIINRTLVFAVLTALVIGIYALVISLLTLLLPWSGHWSISLIATGLVAILFQPLHERLQRAVNRLMYGERDDPYAVLARFGRRLETTLAPEAILPTIAETIAQTLKLPAVAVALKEGDEFVVAAQWPVTLSAQAPPAAAFPLVHQTEVVGQLCVTPRAVDEPFTAGEQRLLEDIAHQAGIAVHAVRLANDLQRSRQRLVTAREEERRRLRRDLHDGLGPVLAGLMLKVDTARDSVGDPVAASVLLRDIKTHLQSAIGDIRRLVYNLRPPALDEFGLEGAIQEYLLQLNLPAGLELHLEAGLAATGALPSLPAAVEVAAYRIVQEAVTNVLRHAQARHAWVRLAVDQPGCLCIEVCDDGQGLPLGWRAGVGVTAMRERVAELGGVYVIESMPNGGVHLLARLPWQEE